jgi:hypothetical protein
MRYLLITVFLSAVLCPAFAQVYPEIVSVSFENHWDDLDHSQDLSCHGLTVELQLDGQTITPTYAEGGFVVPDEFKKLKDSGQATQKEISARVTCDGHSLEFPGVSANWVSEGRWTVGIDYPPFVHFTHHGMVEKGAWVSYLGFESTGDGIELWIAHPEPLPGMVEQWLKEQPTAAGERARDIAYALAVSNADYQRNRDYLIRLLGDCLARAKGSPEENGCDYELTDDVINLYWRGDKTLLQPLLDLAHWHDKDVADDIGTFYGDLLDRQPDVVLSSLRTMDAEHQNRVCEFAGEDDFWLDSPQMQRVHKSLTAAGDEVAIRCLQVAEAAAAKPSH